MTVSIEAVAQALQFIEDQHMAVLKYRDKEIGRHSRRANAAIKRAEAAETERDEALAALALEQRTP